MSGTAFKGQIPVFMSPSFSLSLSLSPSEMEVVASHPDWFTKRSMCLCDSYCELLKCEVRAELNVPYWFTDFTAVLCYRCDKARARRHRSSPCFSMCENKQQHGFRLQTTRAS